MSYRPPELYDPKHHDASQFDCGIQPLNSYLHRIAEWAQQTGDARIFVVATADHEVAGYYTLSAASVEFEHAPLRLRKGAARRPVPAILLGRLAVDHRHAGRGLGTGMLRDAMLRVAQAADTVGIRALLVHAKNDEARDWYRAQAEFLPSPLSPLTLMLPLQDITSALPS
ncbi:MAG: GNAT family N-acetyltransferase [Egibacteraceae bacterium]